MEECSCHARRSTKAPMPCNYGAQHTACAKLPGQACGAFIRMGLKPAAGAAARLMGLYGVRDSAALSVK
jgi:hypothetical protein